jgi:hypothetical protein
MVLFVRSESFWDRSNTPAFYDYSAQVAALGSASIQVTHCQMEPSGTRQGYCVVTGSPAELSQMVQAMGFQSYAPAYAGHGGCEVWRAGRPVASGWERTPQSQVPPTQRNVRISRVWVDGNEACLDLSYPYG